MPAKNAAQQVKEVLAAAGLPTEAASQWKPFDRNALAQIIDVAPIVDVHLTQHVLRGPSIFSKATTPTPVATWPGVETRLLFASPAEWLRIRLAERPDLGVEPSGDFLFELTIPGAPQQGIAYGFTVYLQRAAQPGQPTGTVFPSGAISAGIGPTVAPPNWGAMPQLVNNFKRQGLSETQAYEQATQLIQTQPQLAATLAGTAVKNEDDEMGGFANMFMQMEMLRAQREERAEERRLRSQQTESPQVKALEAQLKAMEKQLEETRREKQEQRFEQAISHLGTQIKELTQNRNQGPDATVAAISALGGLFGGQAQGAVEAEKLKSTQFTDMMKIMMEQNAGRRGEVDAIMKRSMDMAEFQLKERQMRLEEPLKQAELLNSFMGMYGGMMQSYAALYQQLQGNNPLWDQIGQFLSVAPEMVRELAGVDTTRGQPVVQFQEPQAAHAERIAADQAARELYAGKPPQQIQETASAPSTTTAPPATPREQAEHIIGALGLEPAKAHLDDEEFVAFINLFASDNADAGALGVRLAQFLASGDEVYDVVDAELVEALLTAGWAEDRVQTFIAAFTATMQELSEKAA